MLGWQVDQNTLNQQAPQAVLRIREAFEGVEAVAQWLANHPKVGNVDPLVTDYNYTADEAYILRIYFETMYNFRTSQSAIFDIGRKMTGLQ